MEDENFLTDDFLRQLIDVGEADILVGLPTHNNAKSVGSIVYAIRDGILRGFPRERVVIINADGGSRDGTRELITSLSINDVHPVSGVYALRTLHAISTQYAGTPHSGVALRTILSAAELLRAKACIVISPESEGITAEWISSLIRPVYEGFDLVTPTYRRHKFDGLLTTNLLYPMVRALYGARIREAYMSEFGFSGRLASQFLGQNQWNDGVGENGTELRMTLAAVTGGFRICQSFLGKKDPVERRAADLVPTLRQSVGVLFSALESNFDVWSTISGSQEVPTTGNDLELSLDPLRVNRKRLRDMFVKGVSELNSVFQSILSPSTLAELNQIASLGEEKFRYPAELWARTVYEFAAAYQRSVINRDHIIQALAPLFRGRVFTFVVENRNGSANDVANNIEALCLEFERLKPYLLDRWKSKE